MLELTRKHKNTYFSYPLPVPWARVYDSLCKYAEKGACNPPPKPLILAGGAYSNDIEKAQRWAEFQSWAKQNGCQALVELHHSDLYFTNEPSIHSVGPMGGPMKLAWNWEAKPCTSKEQLDLSLTALISQWNEISPDISIITKPLRFSGKKKRALLVLSDQSRSPPWGGWESLSTDDAERKIFRQFRASVNKVIAPHMVDHITFCRTSKQ